MAHAPSGLARGARDRARRVPPAPGGTDGGTRRRPGGPGARRAFGSRQPAEWPMTRSLGIPGTDARRDMKVARTLALAGLLAIVTASLGACGGGSSSDTG